MFLLMGVFGLRYKKIGETTNCCFPVFFFYGQRYVKILKFLLNINEDVNLLIIYFKGDYYGRKL